MHTHKDTQTQTYAHRLLWTATAGSPWFRFKMSTLFSLHSGLRWSKRSVLSGWASYIDMVGKEGKLDRVFTDGGLCTYGRQREWLIDMERDGGLCTYGRQREWLIDMERDGGMKWGMETTQVFINKGKWHHWWNGGLYMLGPLLLFADLVFVMYIIWSQVG
jgi:hypothetical protein